MRQSGKTERRAVLVLAPVGAYWKRVRNGIRMILASHCRPNVDQVEVCLVVATKWAEEDARYIKEYVEPLQEEYSKKTWASEFPNYVCTTESVDLEDNNATTLYLLRRLLSFVSATPVRQAFVDLTSGPREWLISSFFVSNFSSNINFYFVKPERRRMPSDYTVEEKNDGGTLLEYPLAGQLDPVLSRWLQPDDEKWPNRPQFQHEILRQIHQIASQKQKASKSQEVIFPKRELVVRAKHQISRYRNTSEEDVEKGISRCLSDIGRFGLFKRVGENVVVTERGAALMDSLFRR